MIGVVPVLPTLTALALALPALLLSIVTALAALRRPDVARQVLRLAWRQKYALLLVAACGVAVSWAGASWPQREGGHNVAAPRAGADWPLDRGGLQRRGWVPGVSSPTSGSLRWSTGRTGQAFWSSPAVVGDRVYGVSSRGDRGLIGCWDAESGEPLWSSSPAGYRATFSSPVISGRYLLCGEGLHHARQARVVCLDLEAPDAGRVCWTFTTNGHVECTPVVAGGRVYVGAGDDGIYCLRLDPSATDRDRVVWHAAGDRYPDAETSLAVWQNRVYAGLGLGGNSLCVLDAATGAELARQPLPYPVFSPPAIAGERLFVGLGRGDYVRPVADPAGSLRCFELAGLKECWSLELPATVLGAVAATSDRVVAACSDGCVYLLDQAGQLLHKWDSGSPLVAGPAVSDRLVCVVNQDGLLVALDARWLQPVWEARLGAPGRYFSAPVIARGHVYVGTPEDGLLCLGEASSRTEDECWPGEDGGAGAAGCRDGSVISPQARVRWQFDRLAPDAAPLEVTAGIAIAAGTLVVPFRAGAEAGLLALPIDAAEKPRPRWVQAIPAGAVTDSTAIAGGCVFAVTGESELAPRRLLALDLATGRQLWTRTLSTQNAALTVSADRVLVHDSPGRLASIDLNGNGVWTSEIGPLAHMLDASTSILVAAVQTPPSLVAIDAPSGQTLWTCRLPQPATTPPAVRGARICLADASGVHVRSLIDGQALARAEAVVSGPLYAAPDRLASISDRGELVLGDPASGRVLGRVPGAVPGTNPLVGFNGVLFCGSDAIRLADVQGRNVRTWAELDLTRVTAPPVLHAGRVYVGIAGRGLVCLAGDDVP